MRIEKCIKNAGSGLRYRRGSCFRGLKGRIAGIAEKESDFVCSFQIGRLDKSHKGAPKASEAHTLLESLEKVSVRKASHGGETPYPDLVLGQRVAQYLANGITRRRVHDTFERDDRTERDIGGFLNGRHNPPLILTIAYAFLCVGQNKLPRSRAARYSKCQRSTSWSLCSCT